MRSDFSFKQQTHLDWNGCHHASSGDQALANLEHAPGRCARGLDSFSRQTLSAAYTPNRRTRTATAMAQVLVRSMNYLLFPVNISRRRIHPHAPIGNLIYTNSLSHTHTHTHKVAGIALVVWDTIFYFFFLNSSRERESVCVCVPFVASDD